MEQEANQIWAKILESTKQSLGEQAWETWFRPIRVREFSNNSLTLEVPNKFFQTWIKDHYLELIKEALKTLTQKEDISVELVIVTQEAKPAGEPEKKPKTSHWFFRTPTKAQGPSPDQFKLSSRYSFENFVVGPSNRFAHA
ncbi:MAG: hypothetical protein ISS43_03435, partial [Candidatus Omnitrophica bacterium]|nr:hypothetical protein [Candidatus Omnitrophota bacterium]